MPEEASEVTDWFENNYVHGRIRRHLGEGVPFPFPVWLSESWSLELRWSRSGEDRYWTVIYMVSEVTQDEIWTCGERTVDSKTPTSSMKV